MNKIYEVSEMRQKRQKSISNAKSKVETSLTRARNMRTNTTASTGTNGISDDKNKNKNNKGNSIGPNQKASSMKKKQWDDDFTIAEKNKTKNESAENKDTGKDQIRKTQTQFERLVARPDYAVKTVYGGAGYGGSNHNKKPPVASKPHVSVTQKQTFVSNARKLANQKPVQTKLASQITRQGLFQILEYLYETPSDLFDMMLVWKGWYYTLINALETWIMIKERLGKQNKIVRELNMDGIVDGKKYRQVIQGYCIEERLRLLNVFMKKVEKIYDYNSMKQNLPNKLLEWLNIRIDIRIGKKLFIPNHKYFWNKNNYMSFIFAEVKKINKLNFSEFDKLEITVIFKSLKLGQSWPISYWIEKKSILYECYKTKLFNYFIDKNITLIYFDKDTAILKWLFEMSAINLVMAFSEKILKFKELLLTGMDKKAALKHQTKIERIYNKIYYDSLEDYLKEQTHFEVSLSIHNGKERLFYFVNTTRLPFLSTMDVKSKQKNDQPYGRYYTYPTTALPWIQFLFEDLNEPIENPDVCLKLNNELGISEKIEDLIFWEILVKDSEKVRFMDSGMRALDRKARNKEVDYEVNALMTLSGEETGKYRYEVNILQDEYSIRLRNVSILLSEEYFVDKSASNYGKYNPRTDKSGFGKQTNTSNNGNGGFPSSYNNNENYGNRQIMPKNNDVASKGKQASIPSKITNANFNNKLKNRPDFENAFKNDYADREDEGFKF